MEDTLTVAMTSIWNILLFTGSPGHFLHIILALTSKILLHGAFSAPSPRWAFCPICPLGLDMPPPLQLYVVIQLYVYICLQQVNFWSRFFFFLLLAQPVFQELFIIGNNVTSDRLKRSVIIFYYFHGHYNLVS